ncbi:hypothetical protein PspS35_21710 [Pseudomonas sp. S35]|uniref:hypothetical protein n=1 Tax=Pseudomonas sp. S35 TaxID=1573719 RepID=UPI00132EF494|nr:hypothetical protein [Pseudomonas sp. S35]QHF46277.1 hypothetical protein PspS35_21710 [Pseudomonas sp. S35]
MPTAVPVTPPASMLPPYTEHRCSTAQDYANTLNLYAEDTRTHSVRQLEQYRPQSLPPTYWQAMDRASPLPEHAENTTPRPSYEEALGTSRCNEEDDWRLLQMLSGSARAHALKHVNRLDNALDKAEQLGQLLVERETQGGTSIDEDAVADVALKIDQLRTLWRNGAFAGDDGVTTPSFAASAPTYRKDREAALSTSIDELWNVANTEYQEKYLPDSASADPILETVFHLAKALKDAEI